MASRYVSWIAGLGALALGGLFVQSHLADAHEADSAKQQIRLIWPGFDSLAVEDQATLTRASVLCELARMKSPARIQIANCLLVGAGEDDRLAVHGTENVATFKRLYRTIAAVPDSHRNSVAQLAR